MKYEKGQWVTINGTHVFINGAGRVSKGPKNLVGMTKEGASKKIANPKSKPDKKKHEGRKSSYQKNLEKELGYSEKKAKQADKNMREYSKLSPLQQEIANEAYNEYFKTHKNANGVSANTYAIKVAKSRWAKKIIKGVEEETAMMKRIMKK